MVETVFIDESGNLGRRGRFFVISCVILDKKASQRWKRIAREYIKKHRIEEIKASNLKYEQKKRLINDFLENQEGIYVFLGVIDKKHPRFQALFSGSRKRNPELAFNYTVGKIFEKGITSRFGDVEELNLVLDERNVAIQGHNSLKDYLNIKLFQREKDTLVRVSYCDSKNSKSVQFADMIANIVFSKFEYGNKQLFKMISRKIVGLYPYPER